MLFIVKLRLTPFPKISFGKKYAAIALYTNACSELLYSCGLNKKYNTGPYVSY